MYESICLSFSYWDLKSSLDIFWECWPGLKEGKYNEEGTLSIRFTVNNPSLFCFLKIQSQENILHSLWEGTTFTECGKRERKKIGYENNISILTQHFSPFNAWHTRMHYGIFYWTALWHTTFSDSMTQRQHSTIFLILFTVIVLLFLWDDISLVYMSVCIC